MFDLTTIAQDVRGQGEIAAQLLLQELNCNEGEPSGVPVLLPTRLVLRGTTAPPASGVTSVVRTQRRR